MQEGAEKRFPEDRGSLKACQMGNANRMANRNGSGKLQIPQTAKIYRRKWENKRNKEI